MREYAFDSDSGMKEVQLGSEAWFKLLALISFLCALVVNAILVWLLVCRQSRIRYTDLEIKEAAIKNYKTPFRKRLKRVLFGRKRLSQTASY
ncbi:hypothetical protein BpHYR1_000294 [Brachionus plicatilis]|uniref:Uncharacterized protein n=1 Tax=Brachionus plicatilis TaxID=10195 RepID=A0A3M7RFT8_BRAPC|nr:hypothetical protein BpHYR1_000294 [Brachionus plicatilis]